MSKKTKYIIVVIVIWLVVAGLIMIPRFIFKQPIPTIATNATNADIVNAIYSLHPAISNVQSSLQNTIYAAVAILLCVILSRK